MTRVTALGYVRRLLRLRRLDRLSRLGYRLMARLAGVFDGAGKLTLGFVVRKAAERITDEHWAFGLGIKVFQQVYGRPFYEPFTPRRRFGTTR